MGGGSSGSLTARLRGETLVACTCRSALVLLLGCLFTHALVEMGEQLRIAEASFACLEQRLVELGLGHSDARLFRTLGASSPDASYEVVPRVDNSLDTVVLFGPYKATGSG